MSGSEIAERKAEADAARAQFLTTLQTIQQRLSPRTITTEIKELAKEKADGAINAAKDGMVQAATHPSTVAAITVPVLVYLFRKPIAHGLSAVLGKDKSTKGETPAPEVKE